MLTEIIAKTFLWSTLATIAVVLLGTPIAYLLARYQFPGKRLLSSITALPLVLPPTAAGFLLLQLLASSGPLGSQTLGFDLNILFTWKAVVLAATCMSMPLYLRTARVAFEAVDPKLEAIAQSLGKTRIQTWRLVTLPLARRGLIAAALLSGMRSMGEFGATVMIAGNIPGRTETIASAIYSAQQTGQNKQALWLVALALSLGFVTIFLAEYLTENGPLRSTHKK